MVDDFISEKDWDFISDKRWEEEQKQKLILQKEFGSSTANSALDNALNAFAELLAVLGF